MNTENHKDYLIKNPVFILTSLVFLCVTIFWILLNPFLSNDAVLHSKYIWGSLYQVVAFIGGIYGIIQAIKWGGLKSSLGKSLLAFSFGLLFQCIGQTVYSYYNLFAHIEAPYPSIGDIGYFGSVIFYILGVVLLFRIGGVRVSMKSLKGKFIATSHYSSLFIFLFSKWI